MNSESDAPEDEDPSAGTDQTEADTNDENVADADGAEESDQSEEEADTGEDNASDVNDDSPKPYDFNHPQHRLGEPIPQLDICGVRIASDLTEALDVGLHVDAHVEIVKSSYQKHSEFIESLTGSVSVFRSDVSPFSLDLLVTLERDLIMALVDLLFGGSATGSEEPASRDLSETEKRFAFRLRGAITDSIGEVCGDCFKLENHEQVILGPKEIATASVENAVLAVQEYSVRAKDQEYKFSIVFPWTVVGSLSSLLSDELPESSNREKKWRTKLREHISASTVELRGKLAETEVTVSQLLNMKRGDFIPLGEVGPATFTVDDTPVFNASVGAANGFVSASILQWTIEGESDDG